MKEVRFNDRFWFGKYKNQRINDIIKNDPNYIIKMVSENKFTLDTRCSKFLNGRSERSDRSLRMSWNATPHIYQNPIDLDLDNVPDIIPPQKIYATSIILLNEQYKDERLLKASLFKQIKELFRNTRYQEFNIMDISNAFSEKFKNLNVQNVEPLEFRILRGPASDDIITPNSVVLIIYSRIDGAELLKINLSPQL